MALRKKDTVLGRKFVGLSPASRLGCIRIIIVLAALMNILWENFPSFAEVPFSWYRPHGFMMFIPRSIIEFLVSSEINLAIYKSALIFFLICALVGFKTRFSLFVATILYFVSIGTVRAYAWFFHTGLTALFLMFFMVWLPVGDALSVDAMMRQKKTGIKNDRPDENYAWCIFLIRAVLAFVYFQAGYAKLHNSGLSWIQPLNLKHHVVEDGLTAMHFNFNFGIAAMSLPDIFWTVLAISAIASEFFYPVVLISWRLRMAVPAIGIFLHTSILFMQNIFFPDLIILQMIFYDWDRIFGKSSAFDRRKRGLFPGRG